MTQNGRIGQWWCLMYCSWWFSDEWLRPQLVVIFYKSCLILGLSWTMTGSWWFIPDHHRDIQQSSGCGSQPGAVELPRTPKKTAATNRPLWYHDWHPRNLLNQLCLFFKTAKRYGVRGIGCSSLGHKLYSRPILRLDLEMSSFQIGHRLFSKELL